MQDKIRLEYFNAARAQIETELKSAGKERVPKCKCAGLVHLQKCPFHPLQMLLMLGAEIPTAFPAAAIDLYRHNTLLVSGQSCSTAFVLLLFLGNVDVPLYRQKNPPALC